MPSLVLGTVQLGMPYGVANRTGQPDQKTATEIVRVAWEGGIREFDTAQEYGESERMLGVAFKTLGIADRVKVVSKLRKDVDIRDVAAVVKVVQGSIDLLGVERLHGLLLHKEEWEGDEIQKLRLAHLKLVEHVGVSVYSPERALQAIKTDGVSIVQIPGNILDRRFERAGIFEHAQERGVEIYVRSVFLQGLLAMDLRALPAHLEFICPVLEETHTLARTMGTTQQALALQYVKAAYPYAHVLIGAETPSQARENMETWNAPKHADIVGRVRSTFEDIEEMVLDPRNWNILQLQHLVTTQKPEKADAIVWLQGNGYDRGAKVLELYRAGFAPHIVVTGNNVRIVGDDKTKISDIMRWLQEHGIDRAVVECDEQSLHTLDQACRVIAMAKKCNWQKILLVGSPHHQLRAFLTFLEQARVQDWGGRIVNQPAHIGWDDMPFGRRETIRESFNEEIEKMKKYKNNLITVEEGLQYFSIEI